MRNCPNTVCIYRGRVLKRISAGNYYVLFADLKAFSDPLHVKEITQYEEFLNSECEFVLLLVDCSYVSYAKDQKVLKALYTKAIASKYENVAFITIIIKKREMRCGVGISLYILYLKIKKFYKTFTFLSNKLITTFITTSSPKKTVNRLKNGVS